MGRIKRSKIYKRIAPSIQKDREICWPWHLSLNYSGYGRIRVDGVQHNAHRVVYEELIGKIPDGMQLDHVCHNDDTNCKGGFSCEHRRCVNPYHMGVVTPEENMNRLKKRRTLCNKGHEFSGDNIYVSPSDNRRRCRICIKAKKERYELRRLQHVCA